MAKGLKKIKYLFEDFYAKYWRKNMDAMLLTGAKENDVKSVKLALAGKALINAKGSDNQTALMIAAAHGNREIVALLLEKGAGLELKDQNGETALLKAVSGSFNMETVNLMLAKGADVNAKDSKGVTVLMKSAMNACSKDMLKALLEKGADIKAKDDSGNTILMLVAMYFSDAGILDVLIANGADITAVNQYGETVIFIAVRNRLPAALKALLAKGADVNGKNSRGETPLSVTRKLLGKNPQWKVIRDILEKAGAKEETPPSAGESSPSTAG
jgi:ankyrin repeat protein